MGHQGRAAAAAAVVCFVEGYSGVRRKLRSRRQGSEVLETGGMLRGRAEDVQLYMYL